MLNLLIIAIVCFLASTLGPPCGIGGGASSSSPYIHVPLTRASPIPRHAAPVQGLSSTPLLPRYQNDTFKQQKYGYKHLTLA